MRVHKVDVEFIVGNSQGTISKQEAAQIVLGELRDQLSFETNCNRLPVVCAVTDGQLEDG